MVKKMQTRIKTSPTSQLDVLLQESSSENSIYGLEFIVDELDDKTYSKKAQKNDKTTLDWFGLSDLCI
jgi:hypothetical protein